MTDSTMNDKKQHVKADKTLIYIAQTISWIFNPFAIPFLAFVVLFLFTYLSMMPQAYKLVVLSIVGCFTILMPVITIFVFKKINKLSIHALSRFRTKRFVPFILTITSYCFCLAMMHKLSIPWYMVGIILAALVIQIICLIINLKWKLSEHMAGMGGIIGGIIVFSALFGYNPLTWLCIFIMLTGILGTARMILRHHTLGEVLCGFFVGFGCALLVLHPVCNAAFRMFLFHY